MKPLKSILIILMPAIAFIDSDSFADKPLKLDLYEDVYFNEYVLCNNDGDGELGYTREMKYILLVYI